MEKPLDLLEWEELAGRLGFRMHHIIHQGGLRLLLWDRMGMEVMFFQTQTQKQIVWTVEIARDEKGQMRGGKSVGFTGLLEWLEGQLGEEEADFLRRWMRFRTVRRSIGLGI